MLAYSIKYPGFAIAFLSLLSLAGARAQAQGTYELRCRGRGGAFAINPIDAGTASLRFTPSPHAAGATNAGLDPGTCSWVDRAINSAEPLQIHFAADSSQAAFVAKQLSDPGNYWAFFVFNTNQGYYEAKSNNSLSTGSSSGEITSRRVNPDLTAVVSTKPVIEKASHKGDDLWKAVVTDVRAVPTGESVVISFTSYPNSVPFVELNNVPPVQGTDKRWGFPVTRPTSVFEQAFLRTGATEPIASAVVTRPAGGDKANGKYSVDMNQELDPGVTYYYIVNVRNDNAVGPKSGQATGKFRMPGSNSYEVRYRGFYSEETTTGPGKDEIYAVVSTSFVDASGKPVTSSGVHPDAVVENVGNNDAHGSTGRPIYQGVPLDLLVTVTLMEHDSGNPSHYATEIDQAIISAFGGIFRSPLHGATFRGPDVGGAFDVLSNAIQGALGAGDDLIATTSRLVTAREMKTMANYHGSKTADHGITYDFFTDHRGEGGVYRVYFDIIPQ